MNKLNIRVGAAGRGYDASEPFPVNQVCSSLGAGWQDVQLFVYETGVISDWGHFEVQHNPIISVMLEETAHIYRKSGRHEHTHVLQAGDFEVLPVGYVAENRWTGCYTNAHLHINQAALRRACAESFEADPDRAQLINHFPLLNDYLFSGITRALREELRSGCGNNRLYIETLSQTLLVHLLRHHANLPTRAITPHHAATDLAMRRVRDYIGDNLADDLRLADIAAQARLSPFHLARLFKQATGYSLHQYVILQRVERAKQLVLAGCVTLKDIAAQVGFADQSHFTRHFRRVVGVTPHEMRKNVLRVDRNVQDGGDAEM